MAWPPRVVTLPGVERSVSVAREWAGVVLEAVGCVGVDDALLVVSELVGNAVKHTESGGAGGLVMVVVFDAGAEMVRIEVIDDGAATVPRQREPDLESLDGRGLWLVERLSCRWGVRRVGGGRQSVWALMPMAEPKPDKYESASVGR
ncbi:ATP-binding protein [Streptosporangium soli]|nr:ATP-binding protein [Streptosporangium sp. KLBMP 9127]